MAYIDARGTQVDIDLGASVGFYRTYTAYTEAGTIYDLTGKSVITVLKDDTDSTRNYGGEYGTEETYTLTITDAANGEFTFEIPYSAFSNKESGRLTHETYVVLENGSRVGIMWGYINVLERG